MDRFIFTSLTAATLAVAALGLTSTVDAAPGCMSSFDHAHHQLRAQDQLHAQGLGVDLGC